MEKNYSSTDHSAVFDPALSLPHFDEEATLLSARPVVPLHEVKAETRSRRRVIFGLTIVVAIIVGAISAILLMQGGHNSESATEAEVNQPLLPSSGAAGGSTSESEARVPVLAEPDEEQQTREVPSTSDSSKNSQPSAAISRRSENQARAGSPDRERNEDFENDERELRRAERKNGRREAKRQRRDRRDQLSDELLRIREIFEGSPRP